MKINFKKEDIKENIPLYTAIVILMISAIIAAVYAVHASVMYFSGHEIIGDQTVNNINVMLTRPENWEKIETGKITLTKDELALIDGSTATIPITAELARQFCGASDDEIKSYVDHNTTHYAYENIILTYAKEYYDGYYSRNRFDKKRLLFATEPSERERDEAKQAGVSLDITPVALDGFVFITHKDNPVDSLTVEQLQQIYSGVITNWKDVGGNDKKIIPYQRESDSGSQTAMEQIVMKGSPLPLMEPAEGYRITTGMGMLIEKIAEYENRENSIGYTYYYYLNNLYRNDDIKVLKIDGISPDNENLISGAYPFSTAYYIVTAEGSDAESVKMRGLRDYLLTDEGQEIIKMAGYCPAGSDDNENIQ